MAVFITLPNPSSNTSAQNSLEDVVSKEDLKHSEAGVMTTRPTSRRGGTIRCHLWTTIEASGEREGP